MRSNLIRPIFSFWAQFQDRARLKRQTSGFGCEHSFFSVAWFRYRLLLKGLRSGCKTISFRTRRYDAGFRAFCVHGLLEVPVRRILVVDAATQDLVPVRQTVHFEYATAHVNHRPLGKARWRQFVLGTYGPEVLRDKEQTFARLINDAIQGDLSVVLLARANWDADGFRVIDGLHRFSAIEAACPSELYRCAITI